MPPAYRFKVGPLDLSGRESSRRNTADGTVLSGFAVSPGEVTAPASVILTPADFGQMQPGTVLVCPTTTPAWTPLFSQARALVTDIGGILAHGSIVAREYGIPAVMGTGVATQRIRERPDRDGGRRHRAPSPSNRNPLGAPELSLDRSRSFPSVQIGTQQVDPRVGRAAGMARAAPIAEAPCEKTPCALALAATLATAGWAVPVSAQIADVAGPGQSAPRPGPQCPQTLGCTYEERMLPPAGYRFQALTVCGANCTTQYWVSAMADGKPLLEVPPVRGGGMIAVARSEDGGSPPAGPDHHAGLRPERSGLLPLQLRRDDVHLGRRPGHPGGWRAGRARRAGEGDGLAAAHERLMQDGFFEVIGGP